MRAGVAESSAGGGPGGAARLRTPNEGSPAPPWNSDAPIAAPLTLHRAAVPPEWVDYNGHMSESCYLRLVGDGADAFFRFVGMDESYRAAGHSLFTAETHLHHLRGVGEADRLMLTLQLLEVDARRLHLFHTAYREDTGERVCTAEQLLLHVDTRGGHAAPLPDLLAERLDLIVAAHAGLPRPAEIGHVMGLRHRPPGR
jgi:acyl-CoA thioester hydrolase